MTTQNRILWLDTLKFLGMLAIYIGHYTFQAGTLYKFVYFYHVPLFFFAAGLFAHKNSQKPFPEFIKKLFMTILVPYFIFSFLSVLVWGLQHDLVNIKYIPLIVEILGGVRNHISVGMALWFLPCIFMVSLYYYIFLKIFKNPFIVLLVSFILLCNPCNIIPTQPSWWFNLDSALFFLFFYTLGSVLFPYITQLDSETFIKKQPLLAALFIINCTAITIIYLFSLSGNIFSTIIAYQYIGMLVSVYITLSLIGFNIILAIPLSKFNLLNKIGRESLMLCGNETILKNLTLITLALFGIVPDLTMPLKVYIYCFLLLVLCHYTLNYFLKKLMPKIFK